MTAAHPAVAAEAALRDSAAVAMVEMRRVTIEEVER